MNITKYNKTLFNKRIIILIFSLLFEFAMTFFTIHIYQYFNLTIVEKRFLQCSIYILFIFFTFLMMKLSEYTFEEIGLLKRKLLLQVFVGFIITGIFIMLLLTMGWRPHSLTLYSTFSFLLVGFSEELFSRGLILKLIQDLVTSNHLSVFIQAIIFGLLHFPIQGNIGQVIFAFLMALIYGAIRVEFSDTIGIVTFTVSHWLYNLLL